MAGLRWCFVVGTLGWSMMVAANPVIVMPADFVYYQMSAGGVIDVLPEDSVAAKKHLTATMRERVTNGADGFSLVELPELDPYETQILDEHVALFDVVTHDAVLMARGGGWGHKKYAFDYTLGPGLAFLADRTGADKALLMSGSVVTVTGGRVAMAVLAAAAVGAAIDTGGSSMIVGQVDLRTGAVEWLHFNQVVRTPRDPREAEGAVALLDHIMRNYPKSNLIKATAH